MLGKEAQGSQCVNPLWQKPLAVNEVFGFSWAYFSTNCLEEFIVSKISNRIFGRKFCLGKKSGTELTLVV